MKARLTPTLFLLVAMSLLAGCASVDKGNDPVIVHAEQTISIGNDAFMTFLENENNLRPSFCAVSPEACEPIHAFAEKLRTKVPNGKDANGNVIMSRQFKKWLQTAATLKEAYQASPSPEHKANLQSILNTITAAVAEAQKYTLQLRSAKRP